MNKMIKANNKCGRGELVTRGGFIKCLAGLTLSGCATLGKDEQCALSFGVVSDIHVTTPASCAMFERALRYFKQRGADAVMIPGDLTDWGLKSSLGYVADTWKRVFGGTDAVPLFVTGNHDYDGWAYHDMTMEMHANGYSEQEALTKLGLANEWRAAFGEEFGGVRLRTVKGYQFLSCEYYATLNNELEKWLAANKHLLDKGKPFFFFQHLQIKETTADSFVSWSDKGVTKPLLSSFANCIAFTGHAHHSSNDECSLWQEDSFTAVACPSLSYCDYGLEDYENGADARSPKALKTMPNEQLRRDLRGGQGYFVRVYASRVEIERVDIEELASDCAPWVVSTSHERPTQNAQAARAAAEPVPEWPLGTRVKIQTRNTERRNGSWAIVWDCRFPAATIAHGHRVKDYELRLVRTNGEVALTKRFLPTAFCKMKKFEPAVERVWFNVDEVPEGEDLTLELRARNYFNKYSQPIIAAQKLHAIPGREKAQK